MTPRKTLLELGPKRGRGRIRVFEDQVRQLVTVQYGKRQKESFTLTPAGRREAIAFARGLQDVVASPALPEAPTVREIWQRYAAANFDRLRVRTIKGYTGKWLLWERFAGHDTLASAVTMEHLDTFKADMLKQDYYPNQVKAMLGRVKMVFRWAVERKILPASDVLLYRIKMGKDAKVLEPEEYRLEEFDALTVAIGSPQQPRQWRSWAMLMLLGHQGVRINAARHLRLQDVRGGRLWWDKAWDKQGRTWSQPILDGALSAILTCLWWRERDGYDGPWLFYPRPKGRNGRADKTGRVWPEGHGPYDRDSFYKQLDAAERRAGIAHSEHRAAHGFRKMRAGEVLRLTGNPKAALDFIGDTDLTLIRNYLKDREDVKSVIADQMDERENTRKVHPNRTQAMDAKTAPSEDDAVASLTQCRRSDSNRHGLTTNGKDGTVEPVQSASEHAENALIPPEKSASPHPKPAPELHPVSRLPLSTLDGES